MIIEEQDLLKHRTLGNGEVVRVSEEEFEFEVQFKNDSSIRLFKFSSLDGFFFKYFEKDGIYKEYDFKTGSWFNEDGFEDAGYDREGYDLEGFNREGFNLEGIHSKTGDKFDLNGFDVNEYDKRGFDKKGIHYIEQNSYVLYKEIIDNIKGNINRDIFIKSLIEVGKQTKDQFIKEKLRNLYKTLTNNLDYWEETIKRGVVKEIGWSSFSLYERTDIPPPNIPNKERSASCYSCNGPLYSDIHKKCQKCGWLICPYDHSCGCGFGFKFAREDFSV